AWSGDVFFFSSRRRHTRCLSDWSSDVCSSDLTPGFNLDSLVIIKLNPGVSIAAGKAAVECTAQGKQCPEGKVPAAVYPNAKVQRSEERRVGKECRCRWSRGQEKKRGNTVRSRP